MDEENPARIIEALRPEVAVKGKDWEGKALPEKDLVLSYGGEMRYINLEENLSTTEIINSILKAYNDES
jgi:D-beta-D-heptose 7-phosphate kinase/D-beta-D-heptose 1-phosphate adenosyltransferase